MKRLPRRVNDAQVERLLDAMKRDLGYRQTLAEKLVEREGVKKHTPTGKISAEWKRRYNSTMRRFQRYVTESTQKRSFARAPVQYQKDVRQEARRVPPPPPAPPRRAPERELPVHALERYYEHDDEEEEEDDDFELTPDRDLAEYNEHQLQRAVVAYYDGDVDDAARELQLSKRAADLLSLATEGEGVQIDGMRGAGEVSDAIAELLASLPASDVSDLKDFHDLLMNLPDWEIGMILADMENDHTTFADWLDRWRNDDMDIDAEDSEYWELWRAAYARATA